MIEIVDRVESNRGAPVAAQLELNFALRQKRQFSAKLRSGEEIRVRLPRGPVLRGGDRLVGSEGMLVEVIAAPEALLQVESSDANQLVRLAYHLGNRHVAVEVGEGFLRIAEDGVLEQMLRGLGATVKRVVAPFEPEAGAYAFGHRHGEAIDRPGRIHEYSGGPTTGNQ